MEGLTFLTTERHAEVEPPSGGDGTGVRTGDLRSRRRRPSGRQDRRKLFGHQRRKKSGQLSFAGCVYASVLQ
jgi:hypothetical protein